MTLDSSFVIGDYEDDSASPLPAIQAESLVPPPPFHVQPRRPLSNIKSYSTSPQDSERNFTLRES